MVLEPLEFFVDRRFHVIVEPALGRAHVARA